MAITILTVNVTKKDDYTAHVDFTTSGEGPDVIQLYIDNTYSQQKVDWYPGTANAGFFETTLGDPTVMHHYCVRSVGTTTEVCKDFNLNTTVATESFIESTTGKLVIAGIAIAGLVYLATSK